jgi:hypothetical protein
MNVTSQRQHCLKQGTIFSKALLLLQHNTKNEIFLSSVKKDKPASGTTKTQELFNPIVCSYLHLGYLSLSSSFKSYILSNFYRAIWGKHIYRMRHPYGSRGHVIKMWCDEDSQMQTQGQQKDILS